MLIVFLVGWDLGVMIFVFMVFKNLWIVDYVSVINVGWERVVMFFVWVEECVFILVFVFVIF